MPKTKRELERDIAEALATSAGKNEKSKEWSDGFKYGSEAARDEWIRYNRAAVRVTLEQLQAYARNDFDLGQAAGYQDVLGSFSPWDQTKQQSTSEAKSGRAVEVDTSGYRRNHGVEPRGRADWTFVIGKRGYDRTDDPALYRPARERGVRDLPYAKARDHAIAEARRRGASIVGVGS